MIALKLVLTVITVELAVSRRMRPHWATGLLMTVRSLQSKRMRESEHWFRPKY